MNELLTVYAIVFLVNAMPALMPPTWMILAFAHLSLGLPVLPLALGGAVAASAGRLTLATAAASYGTRLLSAERRSRLVGLGRWLEERARWAAPLAVLVYSFGPIPSNQLFIAAGLSRMSVGRIAAAFLAGRLLSYPLWIGAAHVAADRLDEIFSQRLTNVVALLVDAALLALLVVFTRIDWTRVIATVESRHPAHARGAASPQRHAR